MIVLSTKTIISYYYAVEMFGYFAFAFSLANACMLLVDSFIFVVFPKMLDMLRDKKAAFEKVVLLRNCYLLCISCIAYSAIPGCWLLLRFMPTYQEAFESFVMLILALAIYPLCYGYNTYMMAQNKEKSMALYILIALTLNVLLTFFAAAQLHVRMEYCTVGIMVAYGLFAMLINVNARRHLQQKNTIRSLIGLLPLYIIIPFFTALFLILTRQINSCIYIWLPFVLFLAFASNQMLFIGKIVIKIIRSPDILIVR